MRGERGDGLGGGDGIAWVYWGYDMYGKYDAYPGILHTSVSRVEYSYFHEMEVKLDSVRLGASIGAVLFTTEYRVRSMNMKRYTVELTYRVD